MNEEKELEIEPIAEELAELDAALEEADHSESIPAAVALAELEVVAIRGAARQSR